MKTNKKRNKDYETILGGHLPGALPPKSMRGREYYAADGGGTRKIRAKKLRLNNKIKKK